MISVKKPEVAVPEEKKGIKGQKPPSEGLMQKRKCMNVLIVDDHKNTLRLMAIAVTGLGHDVRTAKDGEEALREFESSSFNGERVDLVLTDYKMPGMDGLELLKRLKEIDPDLKVIVVTAHYELIDLQAFKDAGALDVMSKPLGREEIEGAIEKAKQAMDG
jgi:CheY-like chemotaxis protein